MRAPADIGMPSLLALPDAEACAALCRELGLSFVELNMNLPQYQRMDAAALCRARDAYGVYFTLHIDERLDVCDFNSGVREAYVRTALSALEIARACGMPVVNMHLNAGVYFSMPTGRVYLYQRYAEHYRQCLEAFRDACGEAMAGADIRLCVENTDGFSPYAQAGVDLLLQSPQFGLTLDVGHLACAGDADLPFYQARMNRLCHMHLHDSRGRQCHLPPGQGASDWRAWLQTAQAHACRAVLEVKTVEGLRASVQTLKNA